MAKFTPGPWVANIEPQRYPECDDADLPCMVRSATGEVITCIEERYRNGYDYEADAQLIACAPDLLHILKELLALTDDPGNDADPVECVFAAARDVIKRAEGN